MCVAEIDKTTQIIRSGYISKVCYKDKLQLDKIIGVKQRQQILDLIESILNKLEYDVIDSKKIMKRGNNLTLEMELIKSRIKLKLNFDTINSVVSINKDRKINGKSYLPSLPMPSNAQ